MLSRLQAWQREVAVLILVGLVSTGIFAHHYSCWSPADFHRPWFIFEDIPLLAGYFQAQAEGDRGPLQVALVERLNAPFQANWSDFPTTEEFLYLLGGLLTKIGGFVWAYNVCLLLAHLLSAGSFYCSARLLSARLSWAALGAVAFANCRYLFVRDTVHINLSFCWLLPFYWVAARWLWDDAMTRRRWAALALLALGVATHHPYYWYFWLVMLLPAAIRGVWRRSWAPLALMGLSVALLLLSHIDSFRGWALYGKSFVAWERTLDELQLYALRIPEFIWPFEHRWTAFEQFAQLHYYKPMYGRALEMDSSYLGLLGLAALAWMFSVAVLRASRGQTLEFEAGYTLWLLLVALGGGGNMVLGSFGMLLFRCSCRFSVLILVGLLLYGAVRASRLRIPEPAHWLLPLLLMALCWWDLPTAPLSAQHFRKVQAYVDTEKSMVEYLESTLPAGSMVFQWPLTGYPETPPLGKLAHYEQMTAWMFSRSLRFSYGDCRGRPESQWQWELLQQQATPAQVREVAQRFGFRALVLYRKGLSKREAGLWKQEPDWQTPDGSRWVYLLRPPAQPELPELKPVLFFDRSFYGEEKDGEHTWRWTSASGSLAMLLPKPCPYTLRFGLTAYGEEREVAISLDGQTLWKVKAFPGHESITPVEVDLSRLSSGNHKLHLEIGGNHTLAEDKRLLLLQLRDLRLVRNP